MSPEKKYSYDLREFQIKCLESLKAFDALCQKHGLRYYIIAGTLLGAIRHKGFIPWDDDIDVALMRDDYDRLMQHADEWLDERFHIVTHENCENYPKYFAKMEDCSTTLVENFALGYVGGLYIDIFPLDRVPDCKWRRDWHYHRFHVIRKLIYFAYRDPFKHGRSLGAQLMALFQKLLSRSALHAKAQQILREYQSDDRCHYVMTHDDGTCAYPIDCLGIPRRYEFEGGQYMGPCDGDTFLSSYYGPTYMQLPPIEKRRSHFHKYCDLNHSFKGVDIETLKDKV